jgi:hypothetical protein
MNSIEYLEKEYNENKGFLGSSNFEQAKLLHKQEIKNAFTEGEFNVHNSKRDEGFEYETSEQYYQETFKKD